MELKDKIINSAYELFAEKGYDKTTVAEIINKADCSKGGFYHHFKSKDEIIEAITMNNLDIIKKSYDNMLQNNDKSAIELINSVVITINKIKESQMKEWPKITKIYSFEGNHILIKKMAEEFELMTTEYYTKLIQKGIKEGMFNVKYPEYLAGVWTREVLRIYQMASMAIYSQDYDLNEFLKLLDFSESLFNNTLGLNENIIKFKETTLDYVIKGRKQMHGLS